MKFALSEMTYLKFFLPLIIEGNKRNISSTMLVGPSHKYNCPYLYKDYLEKLSKTYSFKIKLVEKNTEEKDILFVVEGNLVNLIKSKKKTISLCCSTDFSVLYESYVDNVDNVIFSSKFISELYNKKNEKNLYLGTPKFDCELKKENIFNNYNFNRDKKIVTIFYPRIRDIKSCPLEKIVKFLKEMNYQVVLKSRGKDPFIESHKLIADKFFYDTSWHPHTSLELIKVSDLIINFSSTVIEETTFFEKPLINFHIKPFKKPLDFLYDFNFVKNLELNFSKEDLERSIWDLANNDLKKDFNSASSLLLETKTSSKDILDFIEKNNY